MIIHFQKAVFLTSAAKLSQLPPEAGAEVAFAGRSNVGKSSALNVLMRQKGLARTSKTPGRTQLINFFSLSEQQRLVDLPGYGYAKVSREIKERWQKTLGEYLETRRCLKGVVLLIDIRHPLKEFDALMIAWAERNATPLHILLTKADKLSRTQAANALDALKKAINPNALITIQTFSSLTKAGLPDLENKITNWLMDISLT